jgi:nitrite reductase (NO-forming)
VATAFALAAPVAAGAGADAWLALHLFLVGGLLNAISGATQLLAVTWSASPAPSRVAAGTQRWVLGAGTLGLSVGRAAENRGLAVAGAAAVAAALVLLAASLWRIRRGAVTGRFTPAIDAYLMALGAGTAGVGLGLILVGGWASDHWAELRRAHLTINLHGLVGLVVAGTLPYFVATQARMKMTARATPAALRAIACLLAASAAASAAGHLSDRPGFAGAALLVHAAAIAALLLVVPVPGRRQLAWAGPRLLQLGAGVLWWFVATVLMALVVLTGRIGEGPVLRALAVGGFAQVLLASLAYFGPVLRGGGHHRLRAGFTTTRSWIGLAAANVAAVSLLAGWSATATVALVAWAGDTAVRAAILLLGRRLPPAGVERR